MKQRPKAFFWRRLAAFIIDLSLIYALSIVLYYLLQLLHLYVSAPQLTLLGAMAYFPLLGMVYKSSFGKLLMGLHLTVSSKRNHLIPIFLRELLYKQVFLILPIAFLLHWKHLQWLSPFFEIASALLCIIILFVLFLIFKKTWYDQLANTQLERISSPQTKRVKQALLMVVICCLLVVGIRFYNYINNGSFNHPRIPCHSKKTITPYTKFLENQRNAKDYIFELFETNDIVILCEGAHPEMKQYDFIFDVVSDERFVNEVGHVFSEVGSSSQQSLLDSLLLNPAQNHHFENVIVDILRNFSHYPLWENTNYYSYFKQIYYLNQRLPSDKQIKHICTDLSCDWDSIRNQQDYQKRVKSKFPRRDEIMAQNILRYYELIKKNGSLRSKCLVIMNNRHAFGPLINNKIGDIGGSCASIIMEKYPDKTANVLLNSLQTNFGLCLPKTPPFIAPIEFMPIKHGIWDYAFESMGNASYGFNFEDNPFGNDAFDLHFLPPLKKLKYKDVFTGFVFYAPLKDHYFSLGFPQLLANGFDNEILSRATRINDKSLDNNLKWWTHKVNLLRSQDITVNRNPYKQLESVFELVFSSLLLFVSLLISLRRFTRMRRANK